MNYKQEKIIDLKHLLFSCLKKWRFVLFFMIIGAAFSCGLLFLQGEKMLYPSESEVSTYQSEIDKNNSLILQIEELDGQKNALETYERILDEALEIKDSLSTNEKIDHIDQINQLSDKVFYLETQIAETEKSIAAYLQNVEADWIDAESILNESESIISLLEARNNEIEEAMKPTLKTNSINDYIKYAVIGAVIGAVIPFGWFVVAFICRGKVDGDDTVRLFYDVPVLANIHLSNEKPNTWIDRLLKKWNGERLKIDFDKEYKLLAAKFQSICSEEVNEILICSSIDDPAINKMCDEVNKVIDSRIKVKAVGNPAKEAEAAIAVKKAVVVVAEKFNRSRYNDIDKVAEQLEISEAKIIGFVLV